MGGVGGQFPWNLNWAQNVTLSNARKREYKIVEQKFNPGLALIGLSETGPSLAARVFFNRDAEF